MKGMAILTRDLKEIPYSFYHVRSQLADTDYEPENGLLPHTEPDGALIWNLFDFRTVWNVFLLFISHLNYSILLWQLNELRQPLYLYACLPNPFYLFHWLIPFLFSFFIFSFFPLAYSPKPIHDLILLPSPLPNWTSLDIAFYSLALTPIFFEAILI